MRVSFDFDGTLNTNAGTIYAMDLINQGYTVIVLTARMDDDTAKRLYSTEQYNDDLKALCNDIGIDEVHFACHADKADTIDSLNVLFHIDDDLIENSIIRDRCKTPAIDFFGNPEWREQCNGIIKGSIKRDI